MFNLLFPLWFPMSLFLSYGPAANVQLDQLDVVFAARVRVWLLLVRVLLGLDVLIVSGRRTFVQQAAQHAANPKNPAPNLSKPDVHMRGVAVDVNFFRGRANVLMKGSSPAAWKAVYELADLCGISNGHAFSGYADNNHFFTV